MDNLAYRPREPDSRRPVEHQFREFERLDRCPACRFELTETIHEPDIGRCGRCGLLFRNPRPTQGEIARSYDTGGTFSAWQEEEAGRASMWERRLALIRSARPRGRILDVGTGDGR